MVLALRKTGAECTWCWVDFRRQLRACGARKPAVGRMPIFRLIIFREALAKNRTLESCGFRPLNVMVSRYYFHLFDSQNVLRDDFGALATDLADAHRAAAEIIEEFKLDQAYSFHEWNDWKLVVTDDSAQFALVLPIAP